MSAELYRLGAAEAARRIAAGEVGARALVESCLARIADREPSLRAWVLVDADGARAQADACDAAGAPKGSLHGVPVGVKDIIDVAGLVTGCGSPIHAERRANADAACVARLRAAGAVVLGKTVTTEFAAFKPPPTRNPHDPARTPGGSSSGSAAAVADAHVPAAIGSQTAGSVIRPASFCGVVGYKPSFDAIALAGVMKLSPALDTLGTFGRTVADAALLARAIGEPDGPLAAPATDPAPPERVVLCRTHEWDQASEDTRAVLDAVLAALARAGVAVDRRDMPRAFDDLVEAQNEVMIAQMAASLEDERTRHAEALSERLRKQLDAGAAIGPKQLERRLAYFASCRAQADSLFDDADLLLTAAAPGPAPSAEITGDPVFNRPWTALHMPALTLPARRDGLPVGAQLVARQGEDAKLIAHAMWIESVLGE